MLFKYLITIPILVTGWLITSSYIKFLRQRVAVLKGHSEFLFSLERDMERELFALSRAAQDFPFSSLGWSRTAGGEDFRENKYLTAAERDGFSSLIYGKGGSDLDRELKRVRELGGIFKDRLELLAGRLSKDIKIAVILFCGAACGWIILIL